MSSLWRETRINMLFYINKKNFGVLTNTRRPWCEVCCVMTSLAIARRVSTRRGRAALAVIRRAMRMRPTNTTCPITMLPFDGPKFSIVLDNGSVVAYDLATLMQYISSTGIAQEPTTRQRITPVELMRMDRMARVNGMQIPSVYDAMFSQIEILKRHFRKSACEMADAAQFELEECLPHVLALVRCDMPVDAAVEMYETFIFPHIREKMNVLMVMDKSMAEGWISDAIHDVGNATFHWVQVQVHVDASLRAIRAMVRAFVIPGGCTHIVDWVTMRSRRGRSAGAPLSVDEFMHNTTVRVERFIESVGIQTIVEDASDDDGEFVPSPSDDMDISEFELEDDDNASGDDSVVGARHSR